jgi:prophage DNA circulation protein
MSGFQNITGFAPPTSASGFMSLLQNAFWRGVPFKVIGSQVRKGRRLAVHEYPFRDGGWAEDMGRAMRTYSFTGYLVGDDAPLMQLLLDRASEQPGPGLLIHPTIGAVQVSLLSCGTAVRKDRMRVIEVGFEFIEQGQQFFPATIIATIIQTIAAAGLCSPAFGADLGGVAGPAAATGTDALGEGVTVCEAFSGQIGTAATDPAALVSMAAGLPPLNINSTYGRYGGGNATTALPIGTTVATLQLQIANQRTLVAASGTALTASAEAFTTLTGANVTAAMDTLVEAMRATMTDPADQIRSLLALATFSFTDAFTGPYEGGNIATVRDTVATACRRAVVVSLARASAAYQPISYQDAVNIRTVVADALDVEITAAGDAGDDQSYTALKTLRTAVIADLTKRGASLPQVITTSFRAAMPSLVMAQMLYRDASRSDQITQEANPPHPAFCKPVFQALAA